MTEQAGHEVVLVRHGETEWSRSGRHTSVTDLPLTDAGRARAAALSGALARRSEGARLVLTSPRRRARETCELAGLGGRAEVDDDLAEWDYGDDEGLTSAEIETRSPGWSLWTDGCPGGESPAQVGARADRVVARCRAATGDTVLFAHAHILRVIAARWLGLPSADGRLFVLDTASLSVLGWERATPAVRSWNLTPPAA